MINHEQPTINLKICVVYKYLLQLIINLVTKLLKHHLIVIIVIIWLRQSEPFYLAQNVVFCQHK